MKSMFRLQDVGYEKNSVITIGTFDGVHLAHQQIIREVVARAKKRNGRSVVVTFEPHPREVLAPSRDIKLLTTAEERRDAIASLGVDVLYSIAFDQSMSQKSSRDFYSEYIINGIGVSEVVEGYDHHWGHNREGTISSLVALGNEFDFSVVRIEPFFHDGVIVSSSVIREALTQGNVHLAGIFLGSLYSLDGTVIVGDKRGRTLGYPTANLDVATKRKLIPKNGIYFVRVRLERESFFGMASVGVRPTFYQNGQQLIEVHILDFNRDIYGKSISVQYIQRLRDELKFQSVDALIHQMKMDEELSRQYMAASQS
ncbi:MAG TPA: bifunctional riboflavin kinase/FAD synthetase [Bacteroidota bacterium]|nr:bifunctional riboflavin kinase/FAD synthetase [Bacteroidota bacterium]